MMNNLTFGSWHLLYTIGIDTTSVSAERLAGPLRAGAAGDRPPNALLGGLVDSISAADSEPAASGHHHSPP